ncbi:MAG: restriction endonuclease subunit S [Thiobacillus sp.]|nr:restriction endonuclease subunit S [Thiobacillus sp.]
MKVGWQAKQLGDLCEVIAGQSPEGKFYNAEGKGMPFYQGKKNFGEKFIEAPTTWTTQMTKVAKKGDILMSVRAPVGPVNFATDKICIGRGLAAIRSGAELNRDFLFYQLWHLQPAIAGREGAVFASINKAEIAALPLAFAPLPEQQRIVGILDQAFDGIVTAKANAEKNLQNARELISTGYEAITAGFERSKWTIRQVKTLTASHKGSMRTGPFGSQLLHSEFVTQGVAVLGIDNAVANEFRWDRRRYITEEKYHQLARYRVFPGDVLITIMGTCGRCAVVPDDIPQAINTKHLCCITLDRNKCLPEYLHLYFLYDPTAREYLNAQAKGSIMAGLNMGIISELPVRLPPLEKQSAIVNQFNNLRAECERLIAVQNQKLAALDALKQSLLHQAFSGQLTTNFDERIIA